MSTDASATVSDAPGHHRRRGDAVYGTRHLCVFLAVVPPGERVEGDVGESCGRRGELKHRKWGKEDKTSTA